MTLLHIFEQRLSSTQNKRIDHQPQLIDQAQIHQTGYQSGAAEYQHILARLLFQFSNFFHVSHDSHCLPFNLIQGPGKDQVEYLVGPARVGDFIGRSFLLVNIFPPLRYRGCVNPATKFPNDLLLDLPHLSLISHPSFSHQ
jgi:hypothetical protein